MMTTQARLGALRPLELREHCMRWALRALPMLALLAGACDYPTSLPKWDTQWLVPSKSTTLSAGQLLPSSVTLASDNSAFLVSVAPVTISRSLGELCSACSGLNGLTTPKPPFNSTPTDTLRFPPEVSSASLAGGTVAIAINNGLGFDPIRPGVGARGTLQLTLTSGGTTVGTLTLDGNSDALPAGQTTTRTITLGAGAVSGKITVLMAVNSPLGDPVRIDTNQRFSVTATPQAIRFSDVTVTVSQKAVTVNQQTMDFSDIDQAVIDRVKDPSSLVLTIANPFAVTGTLSLKFINAAQPLTKQVTLSGGTTTQKVSFTHQELQSLLGRVITLQATGTVNAATAVKITPAQVLQINTQLELTLGPKEG
jgi:hypothetical protein